MKGAVLHLDDTCTKSVVRSHQVVLAYHLDCALAHFDIGEFHRKKKKRIKFDSPKNESGLVQMVSMGKWIGH